MADKVMIFFWGPQYGVTPFIAFIYSIIYKLYIDIIIQKCKFQKCFQMAIHLWQWNYLFVKINIRINKDLNNIHVYRIQLLISFSLQNSLSHSFSHIASWYVQMAMHIFICFSIKFSHNLYLFDGQYFDHKIHTNI